jgi:hypothetical protein
MTHRRVIAWSWAVVIAVAALPGRTAGQAQTVANLVVGDGVMVVKAAAGRHVYVGAGSPTRAMTLTFESAAVDEFVAETQALVLVGAGSIPSHTINRPVLEERGSGRALSVTRHLILIRGAPHLSYHFFAADERLSGLTLSATPVETRAILQALHRGARTANALSGPSGAEPEPVKTSPSPGGSAAQHSPS